VVHLIGMRAVTVAAVPAQADADPKRASLPRTGQRSNGQPSDLWLWTTRAVSPAPSLRRSGQSA